MSGSIHRFLSRRDRSHRRKDLSGWRLKHVSAESTSDSALAQTWKLFSPEQTNAENNWQQAKVTKQQIAELTQRVVAYGIPIVSKQQFRYALQSKYADGDVEKAFELLVIIEDSIEGILRTYRPSTKLLGAVNREGVTCYLDALLFAMFARLDFFEGVLYNTFEDEPRRNLVILLRLWVNLLRSGKLITTDITKQLQDALAACGWADAALLRQQDASEAFAFITEKLELPLLTLKMDIFHTGKENAGDDHRFINERLLEVAIPPPKEDGPVTLEECLEAYFNNRVEVRRFLQQHNTSHSVSSMDSLSKAYSTHVEHVELDGSVSSSSQLCSSGLAPFPELTGEPSPLPDSPISPVRPPRVYRTSSIVRERFFPDNDNLNGNSEGSMARPVNRLRKGSMRKEVLMPAWQIFSLIPWYTDSIPANDAEIATHFSTKRPILGMCLKRYSVLPDGKTVRLNTYVDIPTEIGLPHFIKDDNLEDDAPLFGNFKLSLQAVVCHRGTSVDSGHYISLVRGTSLANSGSSLSECSLADNLPFGHNDYWLRFDDIAEERITITHIERALKDESPYLLFYQILPIDADPADSCPPPYEESDRYGDILFEKGIYKAIHSSSNGDSQELTRLDPSIEDPDWLQVKPPDETASNGTCDISQSISKSSQKRSQSRNKSSSSEKKLSAALSYLSRRKSAEPLSASPSTESTNSRPQRHSEDMSRAIESNIRPMRSGKVTQPDRECVVM
ncbi:conserved hypothetical protein [Uncinocarpus reesii 1704]|uniref:ubiquitinyl hydrolase 1 n=1 Tax=Uncinocarpus reesii (strain UAMH 1704) TaxID=336963 RepID=C4JNE5_UNCRE|nr:uncharacterized protein UREG_04351 [Uncinocarpus reesii 1704]EEP79505.1 conserved hypothetical protein [Uncinocarpus reesii 1704]